jgi:hypothetical protein
MLGPGRATLAMVLYKGPYDGQSRVTWQLLLHELGAWMKRVVPHGPGPVRQLDRPFGQLYRGKAWEAG